MIRLTLPEGRSNSGLLEMNLPVTTVQGSEFRGLEYSRNEYFRLAAGSSISDCNGLAPDMKTKRKDFGSLANLNKKRFLKVNMEQLSTNVSHIMSYLNLTVK